MKNYIKAWTHRPHFLREVGIFGGIFVLLVVGFILWPKSNSDLAHRNTTQKQYETIHPEISETFATQKYLGRVYDNSYTMIHPRREGLIKDVLVDIGDTVTQGQTIAVMFPPGVEGQSSAQISKAHAQFLQAQESLNNVQNVAQNSVQLAEKNRKQAETALRTTTNNSSTGTRSESDQKLEEVVTLAGQIMQSLRRILFGDNWQSSVNNNVVGNFSNSIQKNKTYTLYQDVARYEETFLSLSREQQTTQAYAYLQKVEDLLKATDILYRSASTSKNMSSEKIKNNIDMIFASQNKLLSAKEKLDDVNISTEKIAVTLESATEGYELTTSNAQKSVDDARNRLEVARAAYLAELAKSGHEKIVAPFSGVIIGRNAEVGHHVSPMSPIFEMIGAETTLGQEHQVEIRFGVPEEDMGNIQVGDTVEISFSRSPKYLSGEIVRRSSALDQMRQLGEMTAIVENPKNQTLRHNTNVWVNVLSQDSNVWKVPTSSLKSRENKDYIFLLDEEKKTHHIEVKILAEDGEFTDIAASLDEEMNIIAYPSVKLWRESASFDSLSSHSLEDDQ